ncbi:MAG: lysine--tRNA ligase, partial [Zetaproteobacteria bacterium CG23_combo_of_CG06-09_8_20_14_all_54_7]
MSETTGEQAASNQPAINEPAVSEQILVRRGKLADMREAGTAYRNTWRSDHQCAAVHARFDGMDDALLADCEEQVRVAGRMMAHRVMGKSSFIKIQDGSAQIQLFLNRDDLGGAEVYNPTRKWDLGDIVGAVGVPFRTRTGELSIRVTHVEIVSKCLRPLPEKWHGLSDLETRYRQRYVDLMVTPDSRETFRLRSRIV